MKTQLGRVVNKKDRASGLGVARSDVLVNLICNFAKKSYCGHSLSEKISYLAKQAWKYCTPLRSSALG